MIYTEISRLSDIPVKCHLASNHSMRLEGTEGPWSITEHEFDFISQFVICRGSKTVLEIGTGFGISLLSFALAMKYTNGLAVSMDCYKEERGRPKRTDETIYENSKGYQVASFLLRHYGLDRFGRPVLGFSPKDVPRIVQENFGEDAIDCVFIDAYHDPYSVGRDFNAVLPFLSPDATVFFHDSEHIDGLMKTQIEESMGAKLVHCPTRGSNLTRICR